MRRFICNFVILCIPLFAVSAIIEVALLYRINQYSYKHQYVMSHLDDIHVLLMGNSHILDGLIPDSMGIGAFNHAIKGRPYDYDAELLNMYVPEMKNLEAVIMPLDYFSFYLGRGKDRQREQEILMGSTHKCMYYKYMGIETDFWYWPELLNSKLSFMERFWESPQKARECDSLGYNTYNISNRKLGWEDVGVLNMIDTSKDIDRESFRHLCKQYHKMADVTSKSNVRLILVGTPYYKSSHHAFNKEVIKEVHEFADNLKKDYPNVEYYDFTFDKRFGSDDFRDAAHLNENGAVLFSRIMKGILYNINEND